MHVYKRAHNPRLPRFPHTHTLDRYAYTYTHIRTHARTPMRAQTSRCIHAYIYVNLTKYNQ